MKYKIKNIKGGYTLVETLFYIALFVILTIAVINSLITMTKAFRASAVGTDFVQSGSIMERISREIRQAHGVNSLSAGDLKLNTKDESGNNKTVRFLLSGPDIQLFENDVLIGNLNTPNIALTALSFTQITTTAGVAVKVEFSVRSVRDTANRIENFYDTLVLRGDYSN